MTDESATDSAEEHPVRISAIRAALPAELQEEFWDELGAAIDEAVERDDPTIIDPVRERWWARAQALAADASSLEVKPEGDEPLRPFLIPAGDEDDTPPPDIAVPAVR